VVVTDSNIQLRGRVAQSSKWLAVVGNIGISLTCLIWLFLSLVLIFAKNKGNNIPFTFHIFLSLMEFVLLSLILGGTATLINEWNRRSMEIPIAWEDLLEMQVEPGERWAILIYQVSPARLGRKEELFSLPISDPQRVYIRALTDLVEQHAPERVRRDVSFKWTPTVIIVIALCLAMLVLLAAMGCVIFLFLHP